MVMVVDGGVTECVLFQSEVTAVCVCARTQAGRQADRRMCASNPPHAIQPQLLSITVGLVQLDLAQTGCVLLKPAQSGSNRLALVFPVQREK